TSPYTSLSFFLIIPPPPRSPLFPYTTLFRSRNEMLSDPSPPCPAKSRVGATATRYIPNIITYGNRSNDPSPIVQVTTCGPAGEGEPVGRPGEVPCPCC